MLDAARRAVELSRGKKVGGLDPDDETALALVRLLEIMGEAAGRVTPELRERHSEIPGETLETPATGSSTSISTWTWR